MKDTVEYLITDPAGIYVDCTAGGGGHLFHLAEKLDPSAQIWALDKDSEILESTRLKCPWPNIRFMTGDFRDLQALLTDKGIELLDGVMIDLGVSSFQLDEADRGFSFHEDGPLDMRMDRSQSFCASDLVNTWPEEELKRILYLYGEERYAAGIAKGIVTYREQQAITGTLQLVEIIRTSVPSRYSREQHPARRSFQALRIAVNGEMEALEAVLPQALQLLKSGGRLCVISFHSLEDRIVKHFMQERAKDCVCPPAYPICICQHRAELKIINKKAIQADTMELENNHRARSAKLRVAEKR